MTFGYLMLVLLLAPELRGVAHGGPGVPAPEGKSLLSRVQWNVDCEEGKFYKGPTCITFYICVPGGISGTNRLVLFNCGLGTIFNLRLSVCVHGSSRACDAQVNGDNTEVSGLPSPPLGALPSPSPGVEISTLPEVETSTSIEETTAPPPLPPVGPPGNLLPDTSDGSDGNEPRPPSVNLPETVGPPSFSTPSPPQPPITSPPRPPRPQTTSSSPSASTTRPRPLITSPPRPPIFTFPSTIGRPKPGRPGIFGRPNPGRPGIFGRPNPGRPGIFGRPNPGRPSRPLINLPFLNFDEIGPPAGPSSCSKYSLDDTSIVNCTREGRWEHPADCNRFYQCIHTMDCILKGFLFRCPENFHFRQGSGKCKKLQRPEPCHKFSDAGAQSSFVYPVIQLNAESIQDFEQAGAYWDYMPFLPQENQRIILSP